MRASARVWAKASARSCARGRERERAGLKRPAARSTQKSALYGGAALTSLCSAQARPSCRCSTCLPARTCAIHTRNAAQRPSSSSCLFTPTRSQVEALRAESAVMDRACDDLRVTPRRALTSSRKPPTP
eukprot:6173240-Pleurochrysis_carterae.AAC.14